MESQPGSKQSLASLISGILSDIQELVSVEVRVAWAEFQHDLRRVLLKLAALAAALGIILLGVHFIMQMLVQLLYTNLNWPMWACYGTVGVFGVVAGVFVIACARR